MAAQVDPREQVRVYSAGALAKLAPSDSHALAALLSALGDPSEAVLGCAAAGLGRVGALAVPGLIDVLGSHPRVRARVYAALALSAVSPPPAPALPAVLRALEHHDPTVRAGAMIALAENLCVLPEATAAVPRLRELLEDPDPTVRACVLPALGAHSLGDLERGLADPDATVRRVALACVRRRLARHPVAAPFALAIARLLDDDEAQVRRDAAATLGETGRGAWVAVRLVGVVRHDPDADTREAANGALTALGLSASRRGETHVWVIPRAFAWELVWLAALLPAWFALARRLAPRVRSAWALRAFAVVVVAVPLTAILAFGVYVEHLGGPWLRYYLPVTPTLVPGRVAVALSALCACALATRIVVLRNALEERVA